MTYEHKPRLLDVDGSRPLVALVLGRPGANARARLFELTNALDTYGTNVDRGNAVKMGDIAHWCGTSTQVMSRSVTELAKAGRIRVDSRGVKHPRYVILRPSHRPALTADVDGPRPIVRHVSDLPHDWTNATSLLVLYIAALVAHGSYVTISQTDLTVLAGLTPPKPAQRSTPVGRHTMRQEVHGSIKRALTDLTRFRDDGRPPLLILKTLPHGNEPATYLLNLPPVDDSENRGRENRAAHSWALDQLIDAAEHLRAGPAIDSADEPPGIDGDPIEIGTPHSPDTASNLTLPPPAGDRANTYTSHPQRDRASNRASDRANTYMGDRANPSDIPYNPLTLIPRASNRELKLRPALALARLLDCCATKTSEEVKPSALVGFARAIDSTNIANSFDVMTNCIHELENDSSAKMIRRSLMELISKLNAEDQAR